MKKRKKKYDNKFYNWMFFSSDENKKKTEVNQVQPENPEINGGWIDDKLFIPILTKREIMFRYANVWKAIFFFSLPAIILMVVQGLYNILDKSLSLTFATDHAIHNWKYIEMMIVGDANHSIITDAIKSNPNESSWEIFKRLFDVSNAAGLESQINGFDWAGSSEETRKAFFDGVIASTGQGLFIQADKMKEYINVTTQYTFQTYTLSYAFSQIMSIGCGMHFAVEFGRQNKDKLAKISGNGITQSFIVSLIVTFLAFAVSFQPWGQIMIRSQMGGHDNLVIEALAWSDIWPLIIGMPAIFITGVMMNLIRSEGKMIQIMIMSISSLGVKLVVSITAMKFGGLELTGAQLGTVMAFVYQIFYCLAVIFLTKTSYSRFGWKDLIDLKKENWVRTLAAGIPNFINYFAIVVNSYAITSMVIRLPIPSAGPSIAENGGVSILQQLISSMAPWSEFILSACIGLNQGVRTIIAYNYGAGNNRRILKILKLSTWLMFGWFVFIVVLIFAIGPSMVVAFAFPQQYISYGNVFYWYLVLYFCTYPFAAVTYTAFGLYQGTTRSRAATFAISLRSIIIFLPLMGIGLGFTILSSDSIWFFVFVGLTDLVSALILAPMIWQFYARAKYHHHLHNRQESLLKQAAKTKSLYLLTKKATYLEQYYQIVRKLMQEHQQESQQQTIS